MGRKATITQETILAAALKILIKNGYEAVTIKDLAKVIGCSTQPIVWHFKNMEELRQALAQYTLEYAKSWMEQKDEKLSELEQIESSLLDIALQEPNVFRFLFLEKTYGSPEKNFEELLLNEKLIESIALSFGISQKKASKYTLDTLIYTFGIAALLATHIFTLQKEEAMYLVREASEAFTKQLV